MVMVNVFPVNVLMASVVRVRVRVNVWRVAKRRPVKAMDSVAMSPWGVIQTTSAETMDKPAVASMEAAVMADAPSTIPAPSVRLRFAMAMMFLEFEPVVAVVPVSITEVWSRIVVLIHVVMHLV